jgi:hypothetical protein
LELNQTKKELRQAKTDLRQLPSKIRVGSKIHYTRYADDFLIGVVGPRSLAIKIRDEVKYFLKQNLNLELSMDKTKITHLGTQFAKFLGYHIRCSTLKQHISTRRMSRLGGIINTIKSTGKPKILVPINDLRNQLIKNGFANEKGFPKFMGKLIHLTDYEIVQRYNSILRGYMNFYNMAENR